MMVPRSDVTKVTYQAQVYRESDRLWSNVGLPWSTAEDARTFADRFADTIPRRRVLRVETITQTAIIYRSDD